MFISFTLRYDKNCPRKQTVIVVCIKIIHHYFKLKSIVATMSTDAHYFQSKVHKNAGTTQVMYQCNNNHWECITYRVVQALFLIRTIIIPRYRYRPEGFTYFKIELKRRKLTSHTHTHQTMSDWYQLRDDNSPDMENGMHCSIHNEAWYHVIRILPRYLPIKWYRCDISGVYAWAKLMVLLINMW